MLTPGPAGDLEPLELGRSGRRAVSGRPVTEGERVEALRRLGLPRAAPPALIRKRYRQLARELHPDHHPNDPERERRFRAVAAAYDLLTHSEPPAAGASTGPTHPDLDGGSPYDRRWWDQFGDQV